MWQGARVWKRVQPALLANEFEGIEEFAEVAELLIVVIAVAGLVFVLAMNLHGKARAFEGAEIRGPRHPGEQSPVELPAPHFNTRDPDRRGK